jgi:uncharacterized protein (TIGR03089 family)
MELSATSLDNAIAKTAGLLRDEFDGSAGARVGVHLPLHWQRAVWFGACAATGTVFAPDASAADIVVVDRDRLDLLAGAPEGVVVSLAPFGLPEPGPLPPGAIDAAIAMRAHPDTFTPYAAPSADDPLLAFPDGRFLSGGEAMAQAAAALTQRDVSPGERFAIVDPDPDADLIMLCGPLANGGAVVLIRNAPAGDATIALVEEGVVPS